MKKAEFDIIPYQPQYEKELKELERQSRQGKWIPLELVREHFLSRSVVFDQHAAFLAISKEQELIGAFAVANTILKVNDESYHMGILFDARVARDYRNMGIAKQLLLHTWEHYFIPNGIEHIITTMKASNKAVLRVGAIMQRKIHKYPFFYLTIPTYRRVKKWKRAEGTQTFFVRLWAEKARLSQYHDEVGKEASIWKTHAMYHLRPGKLFLPIRLGINFINVFLPRHKRFPKEGAGIRFGSLYDLRLHNLDDVNAALEKLEAEGVNYLSVCCL